MNVEVRPLLAEDNAAALALWESSVRATHHFVAEAHVQQYALLVQGALQERTLAFYGLYGEARDVGDAAKTGETEETRRGAATTGALLGFMALALEDAMLGMLFVAADQRGKGLGTRLMRHALMLGVRKLDVNEQNTEARAFYERRGFVAQGVAPLDGVGNPYPLVHMQLA